MPLLNIFGSIFMFFLMVAWIWTIIGVMSDVFRSSDLGGWAKGVITDAELEAQKLKLLS